jgi:hypothetical protein
MAFLLGSFEAERLHIAEHDAEHEHRHETAGMHAIRPHIGADHRHQGDHRRIFGEKAEFFMRDEKSRHVTQCSANQDTQQRFLEQVGERIARRKFARAHRHTQHGKGEDGAHRVVERGLAHHRLRDALLDLDLLEYRHQRRRIGGCDHGAEQQRDDERDPQEIIGRHAGDDGGDQQTQGGNDHESDPDFFQHLEADRRATVEQDVAGAENQDQLVDGGIGLNVHQPQNTGAGQHAHQQEHHHVGYPHQPGDQAGKSPHGEDDAEHQQCVFGQFK